MPRYSSNLNKSITFQSQYPERFKLIRFEDFWLQPPETMDSLSKFLGIPVTGKMNDVIRTRILGTKEPDDGIVIGGGLNITGL